MKSKKKSRSSKIRGKSRKYKSSLRRPRSAPVRSRAKKKNTSESRKRKSLAESVYGRFQSPEEIGLNYLRSIYDKYGEDDGSKMVPIGELDKIKIKSFQKKEKQRQNALLTQMKQRDSALKQMESIGFEELPYVPGMTRAGKDRPDLMLNRLNCKEKVNWCSTNRAQRDYCKREAVYDKYILPCKLAKEIPNKIKKNILDMDLIDDGDYKEDLRRIHHLFHNVQELNILPYLARYLSFGPDYGNKKLIIFIRCNFDTNRIINDTPFQLWRYHMERRTRYRLPDLLPFDRNTPDTWTEDQFLQICRTLTTREMNEIIDEWYHVDKEERVLPYKSIKQTMSFYEENSIAWWMSALGCEAFHRIDTSEEDHIEDPIFTLLMDIEGETLGVFDFGVIRSGWSWFRRYIQNIHSEMDVIIAWLRNPRVKDETLERFIQFFSIFVIEGQNRGIEESKLYKAFDELTDLLCFHMVDDKNPSTPVAWLIDDDLRKEKDKYMEQYLVTELPEPEPEPEDYEPEPEPELDETSQTLAQLRRRRTREAESHSTSEY